MCSGEGCPLKDTCYRHTAEKGMRQSYFMGAPYKDGGCEYYWETKNQGNE